MYSLAFHSFQITLISKRPQYAFIWQLPCLPYPRVSRQLPHSHPPSNVPRRRIACLRQKISNYQQAHFWLVYAHQNRRWQKAASRFRLNKQHTKKIRPIFPAFVVCFPLFAQQAIILTFKHDKSDHRDTNERISPLFRFVSLQNRNKDERG